MRTRENPSTLIMAVVVQKVRMIGRRVKAQEAASFPPFGGGSSSHPTAILAVSNALPLPVLFRALAL